MSSGMLCNCNRYFIAILWVVNMSKIILFSRVRKTMAKEYHYLWTWDLKSSPEALWPFVSDTNRFNRDTWLPPIKFLGFENGIKLVRVRYARGRRSNGRALSWTYPYRFGVLRRYQKGPLAEMRVDFRLERLRPSGLPYSV